MSILSYLHKNLDPTLWEEDGKLDKKIKKQIINILKKNFEEYSWVTHLYIIGSITGKHFEDSSDIDVTVVLNDKYPDTDLDKIRKIFNSAVNGITAYGTNHPINFYFRKDINFKTADAVYDLVDDVWLKIAKDGKIISTHSSKALWKEINVIADSFSILLMRYIRDKEDLDRVNKEVTEDTSLRKEQKKIRDFVIQDMLSLYKLYEKIHKDRKEAFEISKNPNYSQANIIYKYLEEHDYFKQIPYISHYLSSLDLIED